MNILPQIPLLLSHGSWVEVSCQTAFTDTVQPTNQEAFFPGYGLKFGKLNGLMTSQSFLINEMENVQGLGRVHSLNLNHPAILTLTLTPKAYLNPIQTLKLNQTVKPPFQENYSHYPCPKDGNAHRQKMGNLQKAVCSRGRTYKSDGRQHRNVDCIYDIVLSIAASIVRSCPFVQAASVCLVGLWLKIKV